VKWWVSLLPVAACCLTLGACASGTAPIAATSPVSNAAVTTSAVGFDVAKLQPAWRAYTAVHSVAAARDSTCEQFAALVERLRTEMEALTEKPLSNLEEDFREKLVWSACFYTRSVTTWRQKLQNSDPQLDAVFASSIDKDWASAEEYGDQAEAMLSGD
jgi:hypothetical protein